MPDDLLVMPWRTGRKVGRTVYAQVADTPSDHDILIGVMDTPELAEAVVLGHRTYLTLLGPIGA